MNGQVVREIDRLDPFKALSEVRLHTQRVLDSQNHERQSTSKSTLRILFMYMGAHTKIWLHAQ